VQFCCLSPSTLSRWADFILAGLKHIHRMLGRLLKRLKHRDEYCT